MSAETSEDQRGSWRPKLFISYSRKDIAFANRLDEALKARAYDPLVDRADIYPFEDWWQRIEGLIGRSDTVVFVLSEDAVASKVCRREIEFAASLGKRLAPIVCRPIRADEVPDILRRLNFINFEDPDQFEGSVDLLAEALSTDIAWIRRHTEFGEVARRWDSDGRKRGLLLRSPILEEAEGWIAARPRDAPLPGGPTQDLLRESRRSATRWRNIVAGAMGCGLIVALALSGIAAWQARQANINYGLAKDTVNDLSIGMTSNVRNNRGISQELTLQLLRPAEGILDRFVAAAGEDPDLVLLRIALFEQDSYTLWYKGDINNARNYIGRSLQLVDNLIGSSAYASRRAQLLQHRYDILVQRGNIVRVLGEVSDSFQQARDVADELTKIGPMDDKKAWSELALAHGRIGDVMRTTGHFAEAAVEYGDAEDIQRRFLDKHPKDEDWLSDMSATHNRFGDNLLRITNHEGLMTISRTRQPLFKHAPGAAEALSHYESSVAIRRELVALQPENTTYRRDFIWSLSLLGMALLATDPNRAWAILEEGLNEVVSLLSTDQINTEWLRYRALIHNFRGDALLLRPDRQADAFAEYRQGLAIREDLARTDAGNARWTRDLFYTQSRMFELYRIVGDALLAEQYRGFSLTTAERARLSFPNDEVLKEAIARLQTPDQARAPGDREDNVDVVTEHISDPP